MSTFSFASSLLSALSSLLSDLQWQWIQNIAFNRFHSITLQLDRSIMITKFQNPIEFDASNSRSVRSTLRPSPGKRSGGWEWRTNHGCGRYHTQKSTPGSNWRQQRNVTVTSVTHGVAYSKGKKSKTKTKTKMKMKTKRWNARYAGGGEGVHSRCICWADNR